MVNPSLQDDIASPADRRLRHKSMKELFSLPPSSQDRLYVQYLIQTEGAMKADTQITLRSDWLRQEGNAFYVLGQYKKAIKKYQQSMETLLKCDIKFLSSNLYNPIYIEVLEKQTDASLTWDLTSCCNNIAQSYLRLGQLSKVIDWLEEIQSIYESQEFFLAQIGPTSNKTEFMEYIFHRMKMTSLSNAIFSGLLNTATSADFHFQCSASLRFLEGDDKKIMKEKLDTHNSVLYMRHPDLNYTDSWDVQDPNLQLRGIWRKLTVGWKLGPCNRFKCFSWIWKSRLYVFGGEGPLITGLFLSDIWYLDLNCFDRWHRLPDVPNNLRSKAYHATKAIVYQDHAWLFNGHLEILRFNLLTETWDYVKTTIKGIKWPYNGKVLTDPCINLYEDSLYVFGGDISEQRLGLDFLLALDLRSLQWRHLGGTGSYLTIEKQRDRPFRRSGAISWVSPAEKRFYVLWGLTNRSPYNSINDSDTLRLGYGDDFWSYSFETGLWTCERLRGNFPSPRHNMASVYNAGLNSAICFGGENSVLRSGTRKVLNSCSAPEAGYSYFGDTFIMDIATHNWRQVITRNFPTWRTGAHIFVDDPSGTIYLFGGSSKREYSSGDNLSGDHFFGDIWRLDLDILGHDFKEKTFLDGSPFLKVGSWRRCYACKSLGRKYFRCQGSCSGRFIFCSVSCQKAAWKIHKSEHGCRKLNY